MDETLDRTRESPVADVLGSDPDAHAATLVVAYAGGALGGERILLQKEGTLLGRAVDTMSGGTLGASMSDPRMSRRHAEVRLAGDRWTVRDLGSRNRTRLNGREIQGPAPLRAGDVLRLGDTLLVFCYAPPRPPYPDPELVGQSAAMAAVRDAIAKVAEHDHAVLITGETGTGKDVVARAIHRGSGRGGKFVAINCGGLSEGVLSSELFGHVRGAFTGANANREGLFRAAEKGTLFLDEMAEMPPPLQMTLLRVLETRRVRPVGTEPEFSVDVRVVSATNKDVIAQVVSDRFRKDLYARLAQWLIHLPPLRERREDIPLLAAHFLGKLGAASRPVEAALAEALLLHDWPLNVRGLLNLLSIAVISSDPGRPIGRNAQVDRQLAAERALAVEAAPPQPPPAADKAPARRDPDPVVPPPPDELAAILLKHRGNVAEAARNIGCSRQQLYRWLASAGMDPGQFRGPISSPDVEASGARGEGDR